MSEQKLVPCPHLYVGTPTHDNRWHVMTTMSMIKLIGSGKFSLTNNKVSGGGIHKARNNIMADFLESPCQKLLWIDSDIEFTPEQVIQLYNRNVPMVGMPYCHKKTGLDWSARAIDGETPSVEEGPKKGLQKVAAMGHGFFMVDRCVPEAIIKKYGDELRYIEDWTEGKGRVKYDLFKEGVVEDKEFGFFQKTYVTEDFYFCYFARKCGFDIYADCTSWVKHWDGGQVFPDKFSAPDSAQNQQNAPKPMPSSVNEADMLKYQKVPA